MTQCNVGEASSAEQGARTARQSAAHSLALVSGSDVLSAVINGLNGRNGG